MSDHSLQETDPFGPITRERCGTCAHFDGDAMDRAGGADCFNPKQAAIHVVEGWWCDLWEAE